MGEKKNCVKVNQLIAYPGSKVTLAPWHVALMPKTKYYVSVFGGTAAEFMFRRPGASIEIYNDIDEDLHNMWSVIRNPKTCRLLSRMLLATENGRKQFDECRQALNDPDSVRRAWAYMMLGNCGYPASPVRTRSWYSPNRHSWYNLPRHLRWWCDRMRRVQVEHKDWRILVDKFNRPDALLYCDPPYHHDERRSTTLYRNELTNEDHIDLLCRLRQSQAKVMVCGYPNDIYDQLLARWTRRDRKVRCTIGKHDERVEVLWLNYEPPPQATVLMESPSPKKPSFAKLARKPR